MAATTGEFTSPAPADPVIKLRRSMIDKLLIAVGIVATLVFAIAGGLLAWGANFASDYVADELGSQNIVFASAEALEAEGRDDLVKFADVQVTTGAHAEAYASYIGGHLPELSYAEQGPAVTEARQALAAARDAGAPAAEIDELETEYNQLNSQRETTFKGETLRGLLLSTYAWSTIGGIAQIASVVAFIAAGLMGVLVIAGLVHMSRNKPT